jgi:hypothetical protein
MTKLESIITKYYGEVIYTIDDFDEAVIGIEESTMRLIYSVCKCFEIIKNKGIEDIKDYFYFSVHGHGWMEEKRVIFCFDDFKDVQ